ncbi:MAG: response regulator transcription factor [Oscillospiraceae bacterium]|nr:response regulator transcription factor [Oscillospiraceae bacterium]
MTDILMIEDDPELGGLVRDFLLRAGFSVLLCPDAESGLSALRTEPFRLVLLDVMLPGMDGCEACAVLRTTQEIPVLMMSARSDDESKLLGYETGADDYIGKPFSVPVLIAKIKALLRRSGGSGTAAVLTGCGITVNPASRQVTKNGIPLRLNAKEFELLRVLMSHPGEALSKDMLFDSVWGADCFTEPGTVSVHIRWLREKLEDDPNQPQIIRTVWKAGYCFGGGK